MPCCPLNTSQKRSKAISEAIESEIASGKRTAKFQNWQDNHNAKLSPKAKKECTISFDRWEASAKKEKAEWLLRRKKEAAQRQKAAKESAQLNQKR